MVVVARLLAKEQGDAEVVGLNAGFNAIGKGNVEEVWVHGMWLPKEWCVCLKALKEGKRLVRMTHGSLSPVYLKNQSPIKKRLVSPIERYLLREADKVIATCQAEADWIRAYESRVKAVEVTDVKRFFRLKATPFSIPPPSLHLLYLGRRHLLKGIQYLESAVAQLNASSHIPHPPSLRIVSNAMGKTLEDAWNWCDILILPTLSDNFGLVIAEALERGKCVITTDGAPAWGDGNTYGGRLTYLTGYRDGTPEQRVQLLKSAIVKLCHS